MLRATLLFRSETAGEGIGLESGNPGLDLTCFGSEGEVFTFQTSDKLCA